MKSFIKKVRLVESLMMTPFFIIGFIFTIPKFDGVICQILLLTLHFYLFVQSVYLLNSYFGKQSDNVNRRFKGATIDNKRTASYFMLGALILFLLSIIIDLLNHWHGFVLLIINYLLWVLYAYPLTNFKSNIILGSLVHFLSGIINFLLGYVVTTDLSWGAVLISIYFSLLFVSGHMHHMAIDYEADKEAGMKTLSTVIGLKKISQLSISILLLATIYYIFLAFNSIVLFWSLIPIIFATLLHVIFFYYFKSKLSDFEMRIKYRSIYRVIHAISLSFIAIVYLYEGFL